MGGGNTTLDLEWRRTAPEPHDGRVAWMVSLTAVLSSPRDAQMECMDEQREAAAACALARGGCCLLRRSLAGPRHALSAFSSLDEVKFYGNRATSAACNRLGSDS